MRLVRDAMLGDTGRQHAPSHLRPRVLSIVVLPFANIGGDPEQDYFVDGVTESLTTDLSRISGAFVIARNTAFTFKGKAVDVKKIGRELNVRYVLEGSVQRGGNRLRVNVQLIDAETGNHLWAERFDKPVADLFDMQDEIVSRLANTLNAELIAAEARRAERSLHPDAMDLYFQGRACLNKGLTPENMAQARGFFERALALDPENVEAMVGSAMVDAAIGAVFMTDDRTARFAAAEAASTKALSIAPNHAHGPLASGLRPNFTNRAAQGIAECERALALDRNLADAHAIIGLAKFFLGRGAETEGHINEALRLSPRDTLAFRWMAWSASPRCSSVPTPKRSRGCAGASRPTAIIPLRISISPLRLARLGALDQARAAVQAGLALDSNFTIRRLRSGAASDNPIFLAQWSASWRACAWLGCRRGDVAPLGHVWTAPWQELSDVSAALVGCGHVSGLLMRRV